MVLKKTTSILTNTPSMALVTLLAKASPPAVTPYLSHRNFGLISILSCIGQLTWHAVVYYAAATFAVVPDIQSRKWPLTNLYSDVGIGQQVRG